MGCESDKVYSQLKDVTKPMFKMKWIFDVK